MGKDGDKRRRKKPPGKGGMHESQRGEGTRADADNHAFFSFEGSLDESRFHAPFENTKTDFFGDESRAFNLPPAQAPLPAPGLEEDGEGEPQKRRSAEEEEERAEADAVDAGGAEPASSGEVVPAEEAAPAEDPETVGEVAPAESETIGEIAPDAFEPAPETIGEVAPEAFEAAPDTIGEVTPEAFEEAPETIGEITPEAFEEAPETVGDIVLPATRDSAPDDEDTPAATPAQAESGPFIRLPEDTASDLEKFPADPGTIGEFEGDELPDDTVADFGEQARGKEPSDAGGLVDLREPSEADRPRDAGEPETLGELPDAPAGDDTATVHRPAGDTATLQPEAGDDAPGDTATLRPDADAEDAPGDTATVGQTLGETKAPDLPDETIGDFAAFGQPPAAEPAETDVDGTAPAPSPADETAGATDIPSETVADFGAYERLRREHEEQPETAGDIEAPDRTETFAGTPPPTDIPSETIADFGAYERLRREHEEQPETAGDVEAPDRTETFAGASPPTDIPSETIADVDAYERLRQEHEEQPETAGDVEAPDRTETFAGTPPPTDVPSETIADVDAYERLREEQESVTAPFAGADEGTDTEPRPGAPAADPDQTATLAGAMPGAPAENLDETADFTPPSTTKPALRKRPSGPTDTASMDMESQVVRDAHAESRALEKTLTELDSVFESGAFEPPAGPIEVAPSVPFTEVPVFAEAEPVTDSDTSSRGMAPVPGRGRGRARRARRKRKSIVKRTLARLDPRPLARKTGVFFKEARTRWRATSKPQRLELKTEKTAEWWRRTMLEIGVLYSIIVPIELAVNGGQLGSIGVHPHPYWLIILPMAGARGVVAGLISAAIGALLYVIGASQVYEGGFAAIFDYKAMTDPILFFGVAFFAGELRDELALRYRKLQRLLKDVQERNARLRRERDVLSEANRELERRIVDDSVQFGNMILAAQRIEKSGRAEVFEIALELVEEHCSAAASVLMLLEDGSLDYLCQRGWPDDETSRRLAEARESTFVERAIAEGRPVNGFDPEETPPEKGPLVVVPLFATDGVARALLCLDEIPIERLNESTITVFLGIAEWVSSALSRLTRGGDDVARQPGSLSSAQELPGWLGNSVDLGERLRLEVERCTRYGIPTAFLAIQAPEWRDTSVEGREAIDRYIVTHFTGGLRPSDELFRFGYPGCYLLVLAGTTIEGAEVVRRRLLRRVDYSPSREVGPVEIFASGPNAEAPDLLTLVDSVAQRLRQASALPLDKRTPIAVPTEIPLGDIEDFLRRLRMETSLAVRNGFDLHVVGITAEATAPGSGELLTRHVRDVGHLRPTDGVYTIGPLHCAVVLPCTNGEEAAVVAHRIVTSVRERDPDAVYGGLETQVLSLGANHPDAGSLLSALARRNRS